MTQVFLNHKTEDKTTVLSVKDYLSRCLIPSCYVHNNRSNEYICVYDTGVPPTQLGHVLRES